MVIKFKSPQHVVDKAHKRQQLAKSVLVTVAAIRSIPQVGATMSDYKNLLTLLSMLQSTSKTLAEDVLSNEIEAMIEEAKTSKEG